MFKPNQFIAGPEESPKEGPTATAVTASATATTITEISSYDGETLAEKTSSVINSHEVVVFSKTH